MATREVSIRAVRSVSDGVNRAVIAANNEVPGSRGKVDLEALDTAQYMRNPVVLWMHNQRDLPVARTTSLTRNGTEWEAEFEFLPGDERAERVQNAWHRGFINAASIRWDEKSNELLEWSFVGVPADPDALRVSHQRMIDDIVSPVREEQTMPEEPAAPAFDAEQFRTELLTEVASMLETARAAPTPDPAPEPAPAAAAPAVDTEAEINLRARARADLMVAAAPFIDDGVDIGGMSDEQILRTALGADAEGSVDFMRGQLSVMVRARTRAAQERETLRAAPDPAAPQPLAFLSSQADELNRVYDPNITVARSKAYEDYKQHLRDAWRGEGN